jgi:hypothetical protein
VLIIYHLIQEIKTNNKSCQDDKKHIVPFDNKINVEITTILSLSHGAHNS